ncbi:hypothetical protein BRARA_G02856 [Brassica rapa]|uniref:Protein kinase domain-containing protein n=1 Tax=Brassica campestris TaxID=3711 RepID=A0A397YUD4_BRACM|nr:hypothetical protein BRARA_G02856 [Brassica rapa]
MDHNSPRSRRSRKPDPTPDLYSTFVVHSDSDSDQRRDRDKPDEDETVDLYATMVYKSDSDGEGDEDEDSTLPPLLKRLPKDFGGGGASYDEDDDDGDFGTMIVKKDSKNSPGDEESSSDEEEGEYGTFVVVKPSSSKKGKETDLSTMGRAVASMQESSFGGKNNRKSTPSLQQRSSKMSTTSLPDCVREDPTTKYEFLNELGKGSYGSVYKARDLKTSEIVAIKVISLTEGEEGYEEIRGEIEMLQQCNHPNVVRYLGSFQGDDYLWIVMEYCGGGSVTDLMNVTEEALEEQIRASMALQAQNVVASSEDRSTLGPKSSDEMGITVPIKPPNNGYQITTEAPPTSTGEGGDFGTMIVHGEDETEESYSGAQLAKEKEPSSSQVDGASVRFSGNEVAGSWIHDKKNRPATDVPVDESTSQSVRGTPPSVSISLEHKTKLNSISGTQTEGGSDASGVTLKSETVGKKAFALQDKLWSIYAAGNTVPIPFLRATDISPIALLSENMIGGMQRDGNRTVAVEALQELFTSDPQSKKGRRGQNEMPLPPSVYQRLTSSPPLMNLAQVLAYHRACYEEMPLQEMQATQEQQTIQNLCDTLRTILRL